MELSKEELRALLTEAAEEGAKRALRRVRKQRVRAPAPKPDPEYDRAWALRQASKMGLKVNR
jgi:hypothetical protein